MAKCVSLGSKQCTWICIFLIFYTQASQSLSSGTLEVNLLNGKNLKNNDVIGKMEAYVIIQYSGQEQKSRVGLGEGRNPVWNETFSFNVEQSTNPKDQQKITFRIMDKDRYSEDDFVGEAVVYVKDIISVGLKRGSARLEPTKYRVVLEDKKYYGEIRVGVVFTRKGR